MKNKPIKKTNGNHPGFNKNAEPFFSIIMDGLKGEVVSYQALKAALMNPVKSLRTE